MSLKDAYNRGISSGRQLFIPLDHTKAPVPQTKAIQKIADKDIKLVAQFAEALANANDGNAYPIAAKTHIKHPHKDVVLKAQSGKETSITVRKDRDNNLAVITKTPTLTSTKSIHDIETALNDIAYWAGENLPNYENDIRPVIENF